MKYLKKFSESILGDARASVDAAMANIGRGASGDRKFCGSCGTRLEMDSAFCGECGEKQDAKFAIEGTLEKEFAGSEYSRSKTPSLVLRSEAKALDGTKVVLSGFDWMAISGKIGKKVRIEGTTEDGKAPSFKNPIVVARPEDIKKA